MTGRDGRRGKEHSGGIPWRACKSERAQNRTPQWVEVDSSPLTSWTVRNWAAGAVPQEVPPSTMTTKAQSYLMSSAEVSTMAATNNLPATIGGVATGALYDPQGNLTQLFGTPGQSTSLVTMTYDTLGRVATLGDTANATSQAYLYDDEGLRIKAVDLKSGLTTYNIYNEARQLVATYTRVGSGSLTWKRDILYVGARELAEVSATGTAVILTDHLGTPRYSWSGSGLPTKQKFLPFGESLAPAGDSAKFAKGYTNHEQTDPSGLIYMQARFYAPWYGRFLSPDPARDQHFEDTQSWNIYSYVRNQPTMFGDPTGMEKPMSEQERRQQEEAQKATNTQGFHAGERQVANQIASTISKVMPKGVTISGQAGGETGVGLGGASTNVQVGKVYFSGTPDSPLMKTAGYVSGTLDVGVAGANIASGARAANGESQGPFKSSEAAANGATVIGGQRSAGISFGLTNAGNREEFSGLSTQYSAGGNFGLKLGSMSFSINDAGIYHLQIGPPALGVGAGASASKTFTYTAVSREVLTSSPLLYQGW